MLNDEEMEEIILLIEYRSLRERYVTSFFLKSNRSTITTLLISREILYPTVRTRTPSCIASLCPVSSLYPSVQC